MGRTNKKIKVPWVMFVKKTPFISKIQEIPQLLLSTSTCLFLFQVLISNLYNHPKRTTGFPLFPKSPKPPSVAPLCCHASLFNSPNLPKNFCNSPS